MELRGISKSVGTIESHSRHLQYHEVERHFPPWKVLLPALPGGRILVVGMGRSDLASLAPSWDELQADQCTLENIRSVIEQTESHGIRFRYEPVGSLRAADGRFHAIAVNGGYVNVCDPKAAFQLLVPGGCAVWIGSCRQVPPTSMIASHGFDSVRAYALLPPGDSRIMVSLSDRRFTEAGLRFYMPGKQSNRMAIRLAYLLARFGCQNLLGRKRVVVARKPGQLAEHSYLLDWVADLLGRGIEDMTIYSGTNQAHGMRKVTLQLLDNHGQALAVAKVADTVPASRGIGRETMALKRLEDIPTLRNSAPRIMRIGRWGKYTVQIQTAMTLSRRKYCVSLTPDHLRFLMNLTAVDQTQMNLDQWPHWQEMWRWAHEGKFASVHEKQLVVRTMAGCKEKLRDIKIPFHRVHGDFAPWNILSGDNRLIVVDWEDSEPLGLPLCDTVHFLTRVAKLIRKKTFSLERLLLSSSSILNVERELNILISCLSSYGLFHFTCAQIESLIHLCLLRDIMEEYTGLSFADQ